MVQTADGGDGTTDVIFPSGVQKVFDGRMFGIATEDFLGLFGSIA